MMNKVSRGNDIISFLNFPDVRFVLSLSSSSSSSGSTLYGFVSLSYHGISGHCAWGTK